MKSSFIDICLITDISDNSPIIITTSEIIENGLYANSFIKEDWHLDFRYWFIKSESNYDVQIIDSVEYSEGMWALEFYIQLFGCWEICLINSKNSTYKLVPYANKVSSLFEQLIHSKNLKNSHSIVEANWFYCTPIVHLLSNSLIGLTASDSDKKMLINGLLEIIKLKIQYGFTDEIIKEVYNTENYVMSLLTTNYSRSFYLKRLSQYKVDFDKIQLLDQKSFQYILNNSRSITLSLSNKVSDFFSHPVDLDFSLFIFFINYKKRMTSRLDRLPAFTKFISYIFDLYEIKNVLDLDTHIIEISKCLPDSNVCAKNFWVTYHRFVKHCVYSVNPKKEFKSLHEKERWLKYNMESYVEYFIHLDSLGIIDIGQIASIKNRYLEARI